MIKQEEYPMEFFVGIKNMCPYCRNTLFLIDVKEYENKKVSSYRFCSSCNKIFDLIRSISGKGMGLEVRELNSPKVECFHREFKRRLGKLKNGKRRK